MNRYAKITNQVVFICSLVFLASLLLIVKNTVFWTAGVDDFHIQMYVKEHGHWDYIVYSYMKWDGRAVSPLFYFRNVLIATLPAEVVGFIANLFFLAAALYLKRIFYTVTGQETSKSLVIEIAVWILFALSLWLSMRPHLPRSLYWPTGSLYTMFNAAILIAIFYTLQNKRSKVLIYGLCFVAALSGVNGAVGLFAVLFMARILNLFTLGKKEDIILFSIIILGTALCTFAPGNFLRAQATGKLVVTLPGMLKGYYVVFKEYLLMSKLLFPSALITGLFLRFLKPTEQVPVASIIRWVLVFIAGSLATIVPFVLLPGSASKHTSLYFQTYLFIAMLFLSWLFWLKMPVKRFAAIASVITSLFLLWGSKAAFDQYKKGIGVKKQILQRYKYLESKRGTTTLILVDSIHFPKNFFTTSIWDMTNDPGMYQNKMYSDFFGIGPVALRSDSGK